MSKTVMIVEDNELNMKLFHDLLEAYGYRTIGTRNGFEVLRTRFSAHTGMRHDWSASSRKSCYR
jgi:CheY-like chemotaxis protein